MTDAASPDHAHPGLNLGATDHHAHAEAPPIIFGFWLFLMSDLVAFALLFATYATMSVQGVATGPGPSDVVDLKSGAIETAILLTSTFTIGLASVAMKHDHSRRAMIFWLCVTTALGVLFLGLEIHDSFGLSQRGALPQRSGYLSAYWTLIGTHGAHVAAATFWMLVMFVQIAVRGVDKAVKYRLMRLALFWHMLDIVWVGIFSIVILNGAIK
jgi:cytochrome o ubiquinol oxidase subunit 3